jgi:LAO/AO transport system kinase
VSERTPASISTPSLAENFRRGDRRALSRMISLLQDGSDPSAIMQAVGPGGCRALKVGITGSAGAGKSTLASALIRHLRQAQQSVAVVACDPSSALTGGALLGDRIRMPQDAADAGVFIRSLATRGAAGGLADSAGPVVSLLERFGFGNILLETIGVGQDQLAARSVVDVLVLAVTPAGGDRIQWQKAGLLEVADIVVVNKADLPGANETVASLRAVLGLPRTARRFAPRSRVPVLATIATTGQGISEVWQAVESCRGQE